MLYLQIICAFQCRNILVHTFENCICHSGSRLRSPFSYLRYLTIFRFRCVLFRKQQQLLSSRFFWGELKWDPVAEEGSVPRETCWPWYTSSTCCTPVLLRQSKLCYPATKANSILSHLHVHQFDFLFIILLQALQKLCLLYI